MFYHCQHGQKDHCSSKFIYYAFEHIPTTPTPLWQRRLAQKYLNKDETAFHKNVLVHQHSIINYDTHMLL